jgi:hypothetical protein
MKQYFFSLLGILLLFGGCSFGERAEDTSQANIFSPQEVTASSLHPAGQEAESFGESRLGLFRFKVKNIGEEKKDPFLDSSALGTDFTTSYIRNTIDWKTAQKKRGGPVKRDQQIDDYLTAGYKVVPMIRSNSDWGSRPRGDGVSAPPADLKVKWSEDHGYSETYYTFVKKVMKKYKGSFDYVVIENEINGHNWNGTMNEYIRTLDTARKAIHDVDPYVRVTNSGVQGFAIQWLIIGDYIQSRDSEKIAKAHAIYKTTNHYKDNGEKELSDEDLFDVYEDKIDNKDGPVGKLYALLYTENLIEHVDMFNFHHYQQSQFREDFFQYIEDYAEGKQIMSNEIGSKICDKASSEMVKNISFFLSEDVRPILWFASNGDGEGGGCHDRHAGSFVDFDLRPVWMNIDTFKTVHKFLEKEVLISTEDRSEKNPPGTISNGLLKQEYVFKYPGEDIHVVWGEGDYHSSQVFDYPVQPHCVAYNRFGKTLSSDTLRVKGEDEVYFVKCCTGNNTDSCEKPSTENLNNATHGGTFGFAKHDKTKGVIGVTTGDNPHLRGWSFRVKWREIEEKEGVFDWTALNKLLGAAYDNSQSQIVSPGETPPNFKVVIQINTGFDAPLWLYENGVPRASLFWGNKYQGWDAYQFPDYLDEDYQYYFKRMHKEVLEYIENLPQEQRDMIIAVYPSLGSSGDYYMWHGELLSPGKHNVCCETDGDGDPINCEIVDKPVSELKCFEVEGSSEEIDISLEDWAAFYKDMSTYIYTLYESVEPTINIFLNPGNAHSELMPSGDPEEINKYYDSHIPNMWRKLPSVGHGYQINDEELNEEYRFDMAKRETIGTISEMSTESQNRGWFQHSTVWSQYWLLLWNLHANLGFERTQKPMLEDTKNFLAFKFYNTYAGVKSAKTSPGAFIALRDSLDVSDGERFKGTTIDSLPPLTELFPQKEEYQSLPEPNMELGRKNVLRMKIILAAYQEYYKNIKDYEDIDGDIKYKHFMPKADDIDAVLGGYGNSKNAKGLNDIGWQTFDGNYERYITQIDPLDTSIGLWRVCYNEEKEIWICNDNEDSTKNQWTTEDRYGRYARAFLPSDVAKGKGTMYFDVDNDFAESLIDLDSSSAIRVTYFDLGEGAFTVKFAEDSSGNGEYTFQKNNTKEWITVEIGIPVDYYETLFSNTLEEGADIILKNTAGADDVIDNTPFHMIEVLKEHSS